jgi:hypothetical protein
MYACGHESAPDFSWGYAMLVIAYSFPVTHPHRYAIRELPLEDAP